MRSPFTLTEPTLARPSGSPVAPAAALVPLAAALVLGVCVVIGLRSEEVAATVLLVSVLVVGREHLYRWRTLLSALILVILFIPMRRYRLPADLPFDLEPYRLAVAMLILGWVASLLVDPRVRLRSSLFARPLVAVVVAVIASDLANPGSVADLGSHVVKALTFFLSFVVLFFLIVSVVRTRRDVDALVGILAAGGAIVALLAIYERRTGTNVFNSLGFLPLLEFEGGFDPEGLLRGGRLRVYGSAEHAIALGAAFVMLIPLACYMAVKTRRRVWWAAVGLLGLGTLATSSRTAIVMLIVLGLVSLWLRPRETKRLLPLLVPAIVVVHLAVPGAIGTLRGAFFPEGGLIAEQSSYVVGNELRANGRLTDLGPTLAEWSERPVLGQGFGTRVVGFQVEFNNAAILDNQWLSTLLEIGLVGALAWGWLFVRAVRRLAAAARAQPGPDGWLLVGLTASMAAFAIGMFTYDAFSFIQVTFIFFIELALAAVLLTRLPHQARGIGPGT